MKEKPVTETLKVHVPDEERLFARYPYSPLGRIAFISSALGCFANSGGIVALWIINGTPGWEIVILTLFWLAIAVIHSTRFRWSPLMAVPFCAMLLYLFFTQPYAMASLADPKGAEGGFGKFVGITFILACAFVATGSTVATAVQNYLPGERKAPRWLPAGFTLIVGMIIGALALGALSHAPAPSGTTYTNGVATVHMSGSNFRQSTVTITKGSKLMLIDDTAVEHVLANGSWQNGNPKVQSEPNAPAINELHVSGQGVTIGPFATAGTYHILCTIHSGMNLTVIVQ